MQRNVTIELGERDVTLAAESLDEHGQSLLALVDRWRQHPVEVDWDPQETFEEGVRLCSVAIQLRVALVHLESSDLISPVTDPEAETPEPVSRDVPTADNGELVTHEWRIGDQVHHASLEWVDAWRGSVSHLVNKNRVTVAWNDGIPTTVPASDLEADDGRQS